MVGSRMMSGGLSPASRRGVSLMRLADWSCLMSQVTLGYSLVNSSESLKGMSNPVSKYAFITTGSLPQLGPVAAGASVAAVVGASVAAEACVAAGAAVGAGAGVAAVPHAARMREAT